MKKQTTQLALTTIALVGVAQQGTTPIKTDTAIDPLTAQLTDMERERMLLLTAGATSIYRQAGYSCEQISLQQAVAAPETLPACSAKIAALLEKLLPAKNRSLLPEALHLLQRRRQHVPYGLLPQLLDLQETEMRQALLPVIGERGHWLSRFNPEWTWVADALREEGDNLPENAETLWQEGTLAQRSELLRRLRISNATQARAWLQQVWKQEKAEARSRLLHTFISALSPADEAFLEQALDDRAQDVRATAAHLLSLLPTSAFMQRARQRAENVLQYSSGTLIVTPPQQFEQTWQRDGLLAGTEKDRGKRAYWLLQILSLVPPDYWEQRFHSSPTALLAAAKANEWKETVLRGWLYAALLHSTTSWLRPLWQRGRQHLPGQTSQLADVLAHMPQTEAEASILEIPSNDEQWLDCLPSLPRPWSVAFSLDCIQRLREQLHKLPAKQIANYHYAQTLSTIALAIPPACFGAALAPWLIEKDTRSDWYTHYLEQQLDAFLDLLQLRKRIIEEIAQ